MSMNVREFGNVLGMTGFVGEKLSYNLMSRHPKHALISRHGA